MYTGEQLTGLYIYFVKTRELFGACSVQDLELEGKAGSARGNAREGDEHSACSEVNNGQGRGRALTDDSCPSTLTVRLYSSAEGSVCSDRGRGQRTFDRRVVVVYEEVADIAHCRASASGETAGTASGLTCESRLADTAGCEAMSDDGGGQGEQTDLRGRLH